MPGIKVIKTSAVDGSPVENAVYSIEGVTCAFSTSVSTGPDGSALVEDLPAGVYIVREESVPEPFVRTASEQTIALRPGKISEARFEDYTRPGLEIVKRNIADRSPIEGVTYQVRQIDGDFLDTVETDSSGKAFLEVDPGSYEISEVNVPSNVIISEIPQTIFLEPGVTRTVRFFNAVKPSLTVIKRNSITKDPLENAKFHIYYASDNTETGEINDLGTYYTDSSGRIVLTNVNRGWYKVVEEESPTGFSIQDDGVYEFYLEAGVSRELVVDNTPLSALVVYKYDSATKLPLEGARFELRYLSGETSGTEGTVIGEYVTSKNGSFTVTGLKEGTYICQELESPDGHLIDSEPQTVYISGKEQDVVTLRFGNAPLGSLLITKVSDDEKREPLSDVEFLLTDSSGNFIGTNNGRYVTNSAGEILVEGLIPGTTVVAREVRAKPGYLLDDSPQYALIRSGETVGLEFRNAPAGNLVIVKRSSSGTHEPLEGVEFKITYADGSYVPDENGQLSSNGLYYTDREGKITLSGVVGTIVATETASIPGYTIDEATRTQTVVVHPNDTQTLYVYNEPETTLVLEKFIKGTDREPLAGVEFLVTDGAGTVIGPNNGVYTTGEDGRAVITGLTPGTTITARETQTAEGFVLDGSPQSILIKEGEVQTLTFWNAREGGVELVKVNAADKTERLSDAVFEIRKASDDALVDTVTTGDTGTVFAPLAEGDYYALELESPSGFKLDSTRHYFTVKDGEVTQEVIENEAVSGILLHKVDSATGDGIYGVTFLLYDDTNTPIGQYTSDDRGYVYIEGLESGRFYLRELENEGYIVDTEKKTVYVKSGETTEITWKNTPITGQIQITKTSADYNSMNGWPAGTPIPNTEFEIYNARTGKLVDTIRTDKNGVAVSKPLPLARYEVIESKAADFYGLDKTPIEVEIEYAGQIVKAAMTNKSLYTNVSIKKTGYVEVMPGQTLRYDFTDIANNSTTSLESFYWRERLPAFAHLQKIVTGTWNVPGSYKIVYKTTLSGDTYRVLADNLSTQQNYVLDASPAALGLASGEKATEFMVVFGIVPANFRQVEAPVVYCTASQWLTGGSQIVNQTDVGGIHDGQWIMATSRWATKVYKPAEPLPRTGY